MESDRASLCSSLDRTIDSRVVFVCSAMRQAYEREYRLTSMISSPHVIAAYDMLQSQDRSVLVLEDIAGTHLQVFLKMHGKP
jgi:hypothetical protein